MKKLFQFSLWFSLVLPAMSQPILNVDWNELAQRHELLGGQIILTSVSAGQVSTLKIENTNDTSLQLPLFKVSNPAITNLTYGFIGQVKYENVRGDGYLEMWNYFPPSQSGVSETKYFRARLEKPVQWVKSQAHRSGECFRCGLMQVVHQNRHRIWKSIFFYQRAELFIFVM